MPVIRPRKYKKPKIGDNYGSWIIIALAEKQGRNIMWLCQCLCGIISSVQESSLLNGCSLGCIKCQYNSKYDFCPQPHQKRLLNRIKRIRQRCLNKNTLQYKDWGGRGITLYELWINNTVSFLQYLMTLEGWDNPNLTIDRINNNRNYEPGNLRFATQVQQQNNRRDTIDEHLWRHIGKLQGTVKEIAKLYNITIRTVFRARADVIRRNL